jgi:uncharacterized membrane protein YphA (DoxX/SURF4 family)
VSGSGGAGPRGASAASRRPQAAAAAGGLAGGTVAESAGLLTARWAPVAARVLLGLVLAWFGYHELVQPSLWTGYVPGLSPASDLAVLLVLAHGWVLLLLAVALAAGVAPRTAAAVSAVLLLEIVISLAVTGGLSDLTLRDVGVLGLAVCLTGIPQQRLLLARPEAAGQRR